MRKISNKIVEEVEQQEIHFRVTQFFFVKSINFE